MHSRRHRPKQLLIYHHENITGRVQQHITSQRATSPILLIALVNILKLILHGVHWCIVYLAESVERHILDFVDLLPGFLILQNSMSGLQEKS